MCECLTEIDKLLEPQGIRIATALNVVGSALHLEILVGVERLEGNRKRHLPTVVATYCPFCGEKRVREP